VNMIVGAAGHFSPAGVLDQLAGAVIGEIGFRFGPAEIEFWHFDFRRRAAGDMQLLEKLFGDRVGLLAGQPFRRGALVVTLDRQHVRYAEAGKDVTNVRLAQYPPHVRKEGGKLLARREDLLMVGTVEVVDERRPRYFGDDRSGVSRLYWNVVGADRERRVVARRSRQEKFCRMKLAEISIVRRGAGLAVGCVLAKGIDIERQQDRDAAFFNSRKSFGADRVELGEGLLGCVGAAAGQACGGGLPVDRTQRDGGAFHLARNGSAACKHGKPEKCGTSQRLPLASYRQPNARRVKARVKSIVTAHTRARKRQSLLSPWRARHRSRRRCSPPRACPR